MSRLPCFVPLLSAIGIGIENDFRCVLASLCEGLSVRPSVRRSVQNPFFFRIREVAYMAESMWENEGRDLRNSIDVTGFAQGSRNRVTMEEAADRGAPKLTLRAA